jgi:thiamine pyrophosphokinase
LLLFISKRGSAARLVGKREVALVVTNGTITLPKSSGKYFSVFAFGGEAHGVSIKNARYEIENVSLTPDFPLGVSNSFTDPGYADIEVECGALLIMQAI